MDNILARFLQTDKASALVLFSFRPWITTNRRLNRNSQEKTQRIHRFQVISKERKMEMISIRKAEFFLKTSNYQAIFRIYLSNMDR